MNFNLINFPMFNKLSELTLEKKLYQLIVNRLDGYRLHSQAYQQEIFRLVEKGIGGFIIFGGRSDEAKGFINKIQSISEIPLFIASDVECGVGQQIQDTTMFPCNMAMAAAIDHNRPEDVNILESALKAIAQESIHVGINMPLIPVLDVNQEPDNPIICTRAFSDNPEDVSWFGSRYIRELEGSGLISCAKHFPGHGDTDIDSHISLPVITKSFKDLIEIDLMPFIEAIKARVSSIMVGHLSIPAIDSKPASLSRKIITDLLREELGFDGLILTDALNMRALKDLGYVSTECVKAGADILLHPLDADSTVRELLSSIKSKELFEEQIDKTIDRIIGIKHRLKNTESEDVDYQKNAELSTHITGMSITAVKNDRLLPISDENEVHVILAGESKFFGSSPFKDYFKNVSTIPSPIFPQGERAKVIFAIFTSVSAGRGTSGIDAGERKHISEFIQKVKNSVVISFGCPYVLRYFKEADMLIAAYEATEQAQRAVIKCLKGEMDFKGRLPVRINLS